MEEQINQSVRVQTEFEEWVEGGCKKAEAFVEQVGDAQEEAQIEVQLHQLRR